MEDKSKKKKFWRGDPVGGFASGVMTGIVVGIINILFLHWWHIGIIAFIGVWLFQGTQPQFKGRADKRDKENAKYKDAEEFVHNLPDNTKNNSVSKPKLQSQPIINNIEQPKEKYSRHAPKCPKCKSHNIQIIGNHRKGFSVGKAVIGGTASAFTMGMATPGALAGFTGAKGKKYDAVCMKCGKKFKIKL
jgi:hypothetical protein